MFLSDLSIRRPVFAIMLILSCAVLGVYSYLRLGIDIWPDVEFPFATVTVIYPGAGPEEMETQVVKPIEDEVTTVAGIKSVTSVCQEGLAFIFIEFNLGTKIDFAALEVKDKVDAIRPLLPTDIEPPIISKFDVNDQPIINLAVRSNRPLEEVYEIADDVVKQRLARVEGLAQVSLEGGKLREIEIALSRSQMRAYDLTVMQVIQSLQMANLNLPSGRIEQGRRDVTIRMAGEYTQPEQIAELQISVGEGRLVRLRDIGQVRDAYADVREIARFNGESSVGLAIRKRSDANTVAVADGVKSELEKLRRILPEDVTVSIARDNSTFIRDALADVWSNLMFGILLTALVLFLFTQSWRGTVIASIAMPVSVAATFLPISLAGFTINSMSLMGLAISVGILVNNAIVVLENISVFEGRGFPAREAASKGTSEIAIAVAASTLTNIVVFAPIGFMGGIVGQFFRQFGFTVAFATVYSLLISFTLTPLMAAHKMRAGLYALTAAGALLAAWFLISPGWAIGLALLVGLLLWGERQGWLGHFFKLWNGLVDSMITSYSNSLRWCLAHRALLMSGVTVLFFGAMLLIGQVGMEFFPKADQGAFYVGIKMPPGTRLDETDLACRVMEEKIAAIPELKSYYTTVGKTQAEVGAGAGSELGGVMVELVSKDLRYRSTDDVILELRSQLAAIPAAEIIISEAGTFGGAGESDIQIEVTGDRMAGVLAAVDSVQRIVAETPGVVDVTNSWITGKPELIVTPRREELSDQGFSLAEVATTLRALYEGIVATTYRENGKEYDVRVRLDHSDRARLDQVHELEMKAENHWVPLTAIAAVKEEAGPTVITRKNKQRLVTVSCNLTRGTTGEFQTVVTEKLAAVDLPEDVQVNFGGEAEFMGREFGFIYQALLLAIILTYMLLCAMLESYIRPIVIMLTLPLGLIGVAVALASTGTAVSMMVLMGIVMLVGIVVNNAILIIDYAQVLRTTGKNAREAVLLAAPGRFRPIVMTNLATILGMLPLAIGVGAGGEWRSPMAITSVGALALSMFFTLFVIPAMYELFETRKERKAAA